MISAEAKQWIAIGAIGLLVILFMGRMNSVPSYDENTAFALTALPNEDTNTQIIDQDVLFPTPTYTLAFADSVAVALSPVYHLTATIAAQIVSDNTSNNAATTSAFLATTINIQNAAPLGTPLASAITGTPIVNTTGNTHEIVSGDTLYRIAAQYGISVDALVQANALSEDSTIFAGETLVIPSSAVTTSLPPSSTAILAITPEPTPTFPPDAIAVINATPNTSRESIPVAMNGLDYNDFVLLSTETKMNIRRIFTQGQILGRNARAFSRLGDSTIESPYFLTRFDRAGEYNLGDYGYLQDMIDYYAGSFENESVAIKRGLHTWSVFDPLWADSQYCGANETLLACEIRRSNPSIIFVRLGSNDAGVPESTERSLRRVIEYCIEQGVIPIMGTKADRFEGSNINNEIIRRLANEYRIPLWDFDVVAGTVPGRGLGSDNVHMTSFFAHDWTQAEAWTRGHGVHNLSALIMLDAVWETLQRYE